MSVMLTNNANAGTNGAAVTYYNSGAQSGDAWDYISLGGGNAAVTFASSPARGALSYKWTTGATATQGYSQWERLPNSTTLYVRFYVYLPTLPPAAARFCHITDGTTKCFSFGLRTDGKMSFRDGVDAAMGTSTIALPTGRWVRVEGTCTSSPTAGSATVRIYTEADSPYPAEKITLTGAFNTQPNGTLLNSVQFGLPGTAVANWTCYLDGLGVSDTGWMGPADPSYSAPLLKSNNAEMGSNGTAATMGNSGDSTNSYFQDVKTSATISYSSAQSSHGSLSYLFQPASGGDSVLTWMGLAAPSAAFRVYVFFTGLPTATTEFAQLTTMDKDTFSTLSRFAVTAAGKVAVLDVSGSALWTSTGSLSLNTWYRFEMEAILGGTATTGTINAAYYALDSLTAIASFSTATANLGTVNFGWARFGKTNVSSDIAPFYMDGLAVRQLGSGYIGPYSGPLTPFTPYAGVIPPLGWGRAV